MNPSGVRDQVNVVDDILSLMARIGNGFENPLAILNGDFVNFLRAPFGEDEFLSQFRLEFASLLIPGTGRLGPQSLGRDNRLPKAMNCSTTYGSAWVAVPVADKHGVRLLGDALCQAQLHRKSSAGVPRMMSKVNETVGVRTKKPWLYSFQIRMPSTTSVRSISAAAFSIRV